MSRNQAFVASLRTFCLTVLHCNTFKIEKKDGVNNKGNIHHFTLVLFSAENKISIEDFKVLFKQFYKRDSYVSYVDLHNDSVPSLNTINNISNDAIYFQNGALYVKYIRIVYANGYKLPFPIDKKINDISLTTVLEENEELKKKLGRKTADYNEIMQKLAIKTNNTIELTQKNEYLKQNINWYATNMNDTKYTIKAYMEIINEMYQKLGEKKECPICFEEIDVENIFITKCKHYFCKKCVNKQRLNECALCRKSFGIPLTRYLKNSSDLLISR